ncbi:MAG: hypothetical protein U9O64_06755 [Campylobacterota bacterium]|nr:hypothetical protein [Campylobacterota bacterium]
MLSIKQNGQKVWVTFTYTPVSEVEHVAILGEWSEWKEEPMKQKKSGDYYITKIFKAGDSYQFGYRVNQSDWIIDETCTSVLSPYETQNSLVSL